MGHICSAPRPKGNHSITQGKGKAFLLPTPLPCNVDSKEIRPSRDCSLNTTWGSKSSPETPLRLWSISWRSSITPSSAATQIQHQGTYQLISTWLKVEKSVFFPSSQGSSYTSRWSPELSISSSLLPYQMSTAAHKIAGSPGLIPPIPELTFLLHNYGDSYSNPRSSHRSLGGSHCPGGFSTQRCTPAPSIPVMKDKNQSKLY